MDTAFALLALGMLAAAAAAMSLRNLIHCALCLVGVFVGAAGLFLLLGAEFVAFAQVLVYVGAISILIVFALLLTRTRGMESERLCVSPGWLGPAVAGLGIGAVWLSRAFGETAPTTAPVPVRELGRELMTRQAPALLVVGLLLTAALIGAVVLALREPTPPPPGKEPPA